MWLIFLLNKCM